ncbi:MAG TPA: AAA family ATPase [Geminicoccaceae bacterium]|mgnify:CR=1 FL=1|nr:AAA family ATPase [Geminicoccus sp.]HMU52359.1 AAA family ATPase [Geminicoccaceae bacterium]
MAARARLGVLGGFRAVLPDGGAVMLPTRKAEALLAYLACRIGEPQSRDHLAALLWGDRGDRQARHSLSQSLSSLRAALGDGLFLATSGRETIGLDTSLVEVDLAAFTRLAAGGTAGDLDAAAGLYRGPLLDGLHLREPAFDEWLAQERARLDRIAVAALARLAELHAAGRDHAAAAAALQRAQALDPLCEETHRRIIRLHLDRGACNAAIRHYRHCADLLRQQLGTGPEPATAELYREAVDRLAAEQPEAASPAPPPAIGDRRQATALAATVLLPAPGPGEHDPEELQASVDGMLDDVAAAVGHCAGIVLRRDADAILAVFGLQGAAEDHAIRACHALLRLREGSAAGAASSLRLAVAVDSGEIVRFAAGPDARAKVVGHCLQRAARLAASGRTAAAVTAATRGLARRAIRFAPLPPVPLDPRAEPVDVFAPMRPRSAAAMAPVPRRLAGLVGRDGELAAMSAVLAAVAAGRGQMVAISGEPGIGKSRLCREFLYRHAPSDWRCLRGCAHPHLATAAYALVAGLLRSLLGVGDAADPAALGHAVAKLLRRLDLPAERVAPAVLALLDPERPDPGWDRLEPGEKRLRVIEAMKLLLGAESAWQPVILTIEDLHWLDAASRQVLDGLVDALPGMRVLILVNYRPEFTHDWARRSCFRQIPVAPLPADGARRLLDALVGADPSTGDVKARLAARAGGNPLFLEECVQALRESGALDGRPGGYRLVRGIDRLALPETVQAVIAARLDRLPEADRRLLQQAAVIGAEVPRALLRRLAGLADEALDAGLARLQAEEFLLESRARSHPAYAFKHTLTHEAAYASLLQQTRRELHARILAALEETAGARPGDQLDALAWHAVRGQVWDKAARYSAEAGTLAAARSANRAAVAHLEQAIQAIGRLPPSPERRAEELGLRLRIRNALFVLGEHDAIRDQLAKAEQLLAGHDDRRGRARILLHIGGWHWQQGQHRQALGTGRRALALAGEAGDGALADLAHYRCGLALHGLGDHVAVVRELRRALRGLEARGAEGTEAFGGFPWVFCCAYLAWSLSELGEFAAAESHGRQGWLAAAELGQTYTRTTVSFGLGHCLIRQGRLEEALPVLEEGLRLYEVHEVPSGFAWIAAPLGWLLVRLGRTERGLDLLHKAVDPEMRRRSVLYTHPFMWLAEALLHLGCAADAEAAARRGSALASAQDEAAHQAWAERLLGDALVARDPAAAARHYGIAAELARPRRLRPVLAALDRSRAPRSASPV